MIDTGLSYRELVHETPPEIFDAILEEIQTRHEEST